MSGSYESNCLKSLALQIYKKMGNLPPFYDSPEVFVVNTTEKCDIWSTGIILYILLSGKMPFNAEKADHKYIAEKILIGQFEMESDVWKKISEDAKDLVRQLLSYEPDIRPSAEEALTHPWFTMILKKKESLAGNEDIGSALTNLYEFNADTNLKQGVIAFFSKFLALDPKRER
jgi:calcium-dependent protein kinase